MESARCKAFLLAAEKGSFSRAAEALSYTPSGVSQLVTALEDELGFPLLSRSTRGVTLTDNGQRLLPVVRDYIAQEARIYQLASEMNGLVIGSVSIAAFSSIATHWLPAVIRDFQQDYPKIHIRLMEGVRQEVSGWLEDKSADVAFLSYEEPMNYEWIPLADDPMLAVLPKDHPLAGKSVYPLENCRFERFIMPAMGRDVDVMAMFRRNHLKPTIQYSTLENFATLAMIEQGLGMSIMNRLITLNWQCDVVMLPLEPPQKITMGIALPSLREASPAVKRFVQYAVKRLKKPDELAGKARKPV